MDLSRRNIKFFVFAMAALAFFAVSIDPAAATWVQPSNQPPEGNANGMIHNQTTVQTDASINVQNTITAGGDIAGNRFCLPGSNCVSAWTANDAYWSPSSNNIFFNSGNVGIGSADANARLNINGSGTNNGLVLTGKAIGIQATGPIASYFNGTTYGVYSASGDNYLFGKLGIGTASPSFKLEVSGSAKVSSLTIGTLSYPAAAGPAGQFLANDGTWKSVSGTTPGGAAGGDLAGTYPNPTIAKKSAATGQVLKWNGSAWTAQADNSASYAAGTGLSLSGTTFSARNTEALWNANQLQGYGVTISSIPSTGQVLKWNGSAWTPQADNGGTYSAGTGLSLSGTTFSARNTEALWNASQLQGRTVQNSSPGTGGALKWSSSASAWSPGTDTGHRYTAGTGLSISCGTISAQNSSPLWNAGVLQGSPVSNIAPSDGNVLTMGYSGWEPKDEGSASGGPISGSGTARHIPMYAYPSGTTLTDTGMIYDNTPGEEGLILPLYSSTAANTPCDAQREGKMIYAYYDGSQTETAVFICTIYGTCVDNYEAGRCDGYHWTVL